MRITNDDIERIMFHLMRVTEVVELQHLEKAVKACGHEFTEKFVRAFLAKVGTSTRELYLSIGMQISASMKSQHLAPELVVAGAALERRYKERDPVEDDVEGRTAFALPEKRRRGRPRVLTSPCPVHLMLTADLVSRAVACDWRSKGLSDVVRRLLESGLEREMSRDEGPLR